MLLDGDGYGFGLSLPLGYGLAENGGTSGLC